MIFTTMFTYVPKRDITIVQDSSSRPQRNNIVTKQVISNKLSSYDLVTVCAKFHLPSLSRSGLKFPGGVVVVEANFSVQLKPKPS